MLIPPGALSSLADAGVTVWPVTATQVRLRTADAALEVTVRRSAVPLSPGRVPVFSATTPTLMVVPSVSAAALAAATAAGVSVLAVGTDPDGPTTGRLLLPGRTVSVGPPSRTPVRARPGRTPFGAYAVARRLLGAAPERQVDLAHHAGISQPRVSQVLAGLAGDGLVERSADRRRWVPTDWDALADWWLATYPGPGGIATYWYGLADPVEQARAVVAALGDRRVAVSGDVAADALAPWRRPARAVVYADLDGAPDVLGRELVSSGPGEATTELVVPADHGVWGAAGALPLADGMQVVWDLARSSGGVGGVASDAGVTELRSVLRARVHR